jgi:hypothetical protein
LAPSDTNPQSRARLRGAVSLTVSLSRLARKQKAGNVAVSIWRRVSEFEIVSVLICRTKPDKGGRLVRWRDLLKAAQKKPLNSGIVCRYAVRFHEFQTWHLFLRVPANRVVSEGCKRSPIRYRLVGINMTIWRHSAVSSYEYDRFTFASDRRHHQIPAHERKNSGVAGFQFTFP